MNKDLYFFGGTFDPVHEGHIGVIKELLAKNVKVVVAVTSANPFKKESLASFEQRLEMLRLVLDSEGIPHSSNVDEPGVCVSEIRYEYVSEFIEKWTENLPRNSQVFYWVVGPDIADEVSSWRNWNSLNLKTFVSQTHANDLHSSKIRDKSHSVHSAIKKYVRDNALY